MVRVAACHSRRPRAPRRWGPSRLGQEVSNSSMEEEEEEGGLRTECAPLIYRHRTSSFPEEAEVQGGTVSTATTPCIHPACWARTSKPVVRTAAGLCRQEAVRRCPISLPFQAGWAVGPGTTQRRPPTLDRCSQVCRRSSSTARGGLHRSTAGEPVGQGAGAQQQGAVVVVVQASGNLGPAATDTDGPAAEARAARRTAWQRR